MERDRRGHQLAVGAASICVCAVFALMARSCISAASVGPEEGAVVDTVQSDNPARSTDSVVSQKSIEREAEKRLISYRSEEGCTLECAGYLDLFGNTWGCVVQGDGWVDIVIIRNVAEQTCSVQTIRLNANG